MAFPDSFHHWHNFAFLNRECRRRFFAFIVTSLVSYTLTFINFILGLPSLGSSVAFSAYTIRSSPILALYFLQYAIRIPNSASPFPQLSYYRNSLRVIYTDRFLRGPFCLQVLNPVSSQISNAKLHACCRPSCPYNNPCSTVIMLCVLSTPQCNNVHLCFQAYDIAPKVIMSTTSCYPSLQSFPQITL